MQYMMLICDNGAWEQLGEDESRAVYGRIERWWNEHQVAGRIAEGHQLQPPETATTVRRGPDGNVTVTDGPFLEAKEVVGGYAIIDVADLDAAIALASGWPGPDTIEIRPVIEQAAM
jgi:hypothetical protein